MFAYLSQGLLIGFSAGVTPGPLLAYYLSQAIRYGWRKTILGTFAPLVSDGPIIILVLVLLARIPENLLKALGFTGGIFLLFIAWKTLVRARQPQTEHSAPPEDQNRTIWTAALVNLLNPNPYIFWGTVLGPNIVLGWRTDPWYAIAYAGGFYGAMISAFAAWIVLAGRFGKTRPQVQQVVTYISAAGLAGYGLFQVYSALS